MTIASATPHAPKMTKPQLDSSLGGTADFLEPGGFFGFPFGMMYRVPGGICERSEAPPSSVAVAASAVTSKLL